MEIQMPVEVLCGKCVTCPQLEIIDKQDSYYCGGKLLSTEHHLSCKNLERCENTKEYLTSGGEQIKMKEVNEYVGMDPMDNRGSSFSDIRDQNVVMKEKVNPCLNCDEPVDENGNPKHCLCARRLEYVGGDMNKI